MAATKINKSELVVKPVFVADPTAVVYKSPTNESSLMHIFFASELKVKNKKAIKKVHSIYSLSKLL